jgi:Flp pilus assembly protein TadD
MPREAHPYFLAAARLKPTDANARNSLGWSYQQMGDWRAAIAEYRAALEHEPEHPLAEANLFAALKAHGRPEEVLAHMESMLRSRPKDDGLRLSLAWQLATRPEARLRDGATAVRLAEACLRGAGERADILDVLAAAYAEAGRLDEAVRTALRARDLSEVGEGQVAPGLARRLEAYRAGRAYRQE